MGDTPSEFDDIVVDFVKKFYGVVLVFVVIVAGLSIYDVDISPLLAGAGVAGLVIGLALKETLANVLAGIAILVDRPFSENDRVQLKKPSGQSLHVDGGDGHLMLSHFAEVAPGAQWCAWKLRRCGFWGFE